MGNARPRPLAAEGWREVDEHDEHFKGFNIILQEASIVCSSLHLVGLLAEGEWLARSVVKNSLPADRGPGGYHILDRCAIDVQPIAELAGADLDPRFLALQPYAVEARDEAGPFPLAASWKAILEMVETLRGEAVSHLEEG